jgi:hypothetical protein
LLDPSTPSDEPLLFCTLQARLGLFNDVSHYDQCQERSDVKPQLSRIWDLKK